MTEDYSFLKNYFTEIQILQHLYIKIIVGLPVEWRLKLAHYIIELDSNLPGVDKSN